MADIVYQVKALKVDGTVLGTLDNALITSVVWELGGFGGCTFTVPTYDCPTFMLVPQVEVQIWRDRGDGAGFKVIFWGVVVRARGNPQTVEFQALGLLWYFSRRFAGPILHNYVTNGTFDANLTGWAATGATMTRDTTLARAGAASMKLVSSAGGLDNYAATTFSVTAPSSEGVEVFAAADFFLTSTTSILEWALQGRGIVLEARVGGVLVASEGNTIDQRMGNFPFNAWVRLLCSPMTVPPSTTWDFTLKLYSPDGQINWDQVVVRAEESTGINSPPGVSADVNQLVGNVVAYAQDTAANKSDLNIGGPTGSLGVDIWRQYQFYDQANLWDAVLKPLMDEGTCDLDVVWDPTGATRWVETYVSKGSATGIVLDIGTNIGDFNVDVDGQETATTVVVKGQGSQSIKVLPLRMAQSEQTVCDIAGYAFDGSANGGVVLESVESAANEVLPDGIQAQAVTDLARLKNPVTVVTVTAKEQAGVPLIGVLQTGDTVTCNINFGWVQVSGTWRVVAMTLDPTTETLQVVLNIPKPGKGALAPHLLRAIGNNRMELGELTRRAVTQPAVPPNDVIVSFPGPLTVATSPPVTPPSDLVAVGLSVTLGTAGSTSTTVALLRNGTSIATVTLAAGVTYASVQVIPATLFTGRVDNYALSTTSAGTGAADLGGTIEVAA